MSFQPSPLANALLSVDQLSAPEDYYPLDLLFCPSCYLVQIAEAVPPEILFQDYPFYSSISSGYLQTTQTLVNQIIKAKNLTSDRMVIEIGSNDGYLLQYYKRQGIPVLGIEPASQIAMSANRTHGIETICEFFDLGMAEELNSRGIYADVIHLHNVLAHIKDLNGFIEGLKLLTKPNGLIVLEVPYARRMFDDCLFDIIYHEHIYYFSVLSLKNLFSKQRLFISEIEHTCNQGGSLRVYLSKLPVEGGCKKVQTFLDNEISAGMDNFEYYADFSKHVDDSCSALNVFIVNLKNKNKTIAAYGASAKGFRRLFESGVDSRMIDFVVDNNPVKQGKYLPGLHIPILPSRMIRQKMPDYTLILSWNYADEIIAREVSYREKGGMFIIPSPEIQIL